MSYPIEVACQMGCPVSVGASAGELRLLDGDARADALADEFRVESSLYRERDLPVGRFVLVAAYEALSGRVAVRGQLADGVLDFEPGERVTHCVEVGGEGVSGLKGEPARVVVTRVWSVETSRGNSYSGVSVMRSRKPLI